MTIIQILWLVGMLPFAIYGIMKLKQQLHMMQLNSYMNGRYLRWLRTKYRPEYRELLLLLAIGGLFVDREVGPYVALFIWVVGYLIMIRNAKGAPAKKPLVFTKRAVRLFAVALLIYFLLAAAIFWPLFIQAGSLYLSAIALLALIAMTMIAPFIMALANLLVAPLEEGIKRKLYVEARERLAAQPNLIKIAVTGSYGKTSVKHILNSIMQTQFETLMPPGSYNTPMGVTKIVREELKPLHQVFITEMGAKQTGDIAELCALVMPDHGILTALGEQHLETFGSFENIIDTKFELMEAVPAEGYAVVNYDDAAIAANRHRIHSRLVKYGLYADDLDYRASHLTYQRGGTEFVLTTREGEMETIRTRLLGEHNVYNIVGAIALSHKLGVPLVAAKRAVSSLPPVEHRLQLKTAANGLVIIDDAFNANPAGARVALTVLEHMEGGKKFLITPGMIELGDRQEEENYQFGQGAAAVCDYIVLVGLKQTEPIKRGALDADFPADRLFSAPDLTAANTFVYGRAVSGDVILYENDLPDTYNE